MWARRRSSGAPEDFPPPRPACGGQGVAEHGGVQLEFVAEMVVDGGEVDAGASVICLTVPACKPRSANTWPAASMSLRRVSWRWRCS